MPGNRPALPAAAMLALALPALAGCLATPAAEPPAPPGGAGAGAAGVFLGGPLTVTAAVEVDPLRRGAEPSVAIAPDGTLYIAAPTGFVSRTMNPTSIPGDLPNGGVYQGGIWRSTDAGATWAYLGLGPLPYRNPYPGGGDSDVVVDASGRVYVTDLWLGDASIMVSEDRGETWLKGSPLGFYTPGDDRQWLVAGEDGVAYHVVNQLASGLWVYRTTDGGTTWLPSFAVPSAERNCFCPPGLLALGPGGEVYLAYYNLEGMLFLAVSTDGGVTWEKRETKLPSYRPMAIVTTDAAGNLYTVFGEGEVEGGFSERILFARSADGGATWSEPVEVSRGAGARLFPWADGGPEGVVAVAWYEVRGGKWSVEGALMHYAAGDRPVLHPVTIDPGPLHEGAFNRDVFGDFFEVAATEDALGLVAVYNYNDRDDARMRFVKAVL